LQARARRSREAILETAHALLRARGAEALTTVAIAEASGLSVGALYRFFPNKEAIVCELYETKLAQVRALGLVNRRGEPGITPWRDFFLGYFEALKAAEREVGFDVALADAIFLLPQLDIIDERHARIFADSLAADMKRFGSPWCDAALFDLAMNLYALDGSTWACWHYSGRYPSLAIARLYEAMLTLMRPAMEGDPEPGEPAIRRP
jgi:AcrR family transcriptional regulator